MKKLILSLLLLAATLMLIGGAGIQIWYAMQNQKAADLAGAEYLAQGPIVGWRIVCDGMVDPIQGKVEITSDVGGHIEELLVQEGQAVKKDDVLVVMNSERQAAEADIARAELALAEARLERLKAGEGDEEVASAWARVRSHEEALTYARSELRRLTDLKDQAIISVDELEGKAQQVKSMESEIESLRQAAAAMSRGGFREELAVAEAEVDVARRRLERAVLELEKTRVRAPRDGVVLEIYRHVGDHIDDLVAATLTPILGFADTSRLQIRAEIVEGDVYEIHPGLEGTFLISGLAGDKTGRVVVNRILPDFQNRRLMMTDTRMPVDARTTTALCDITETGFPVYPGQRVTVMFVQSPVDRRQLEGRAGADENGGEAAGGKGSIQKLLGKIGRSGAETGQGEERTGGITQESAGAPPADTPTPGLAEPADATTYAAP